MLRALVILAVLALARPAGAQLEKLLRPPIDEEMFDGACGMLGLTGAELSAARALYAAFGEEYRREAESFRALNVRLQKAANDKDPGARALREEWEAAFPAFVREKRRLEAGLVSDLRLLLSERQREEVWPAAERLFRRGTLGVTISQRVTWWCRVDLLALVEEAGLSAEERAAVAPVLLAYEVELDRPLAERQKMWDLDIARPPERREDPDLYRRNRELGDRIAVLNRRVLRRLVGILPAGKGRLLEELAYRRAYDHVYGQPRPAAALLERALALKDLSAEQRERLGAARAAYEGGSARVEAEGRAVYDRGDEAMGALAGLSDREAAELAGRGEDPFSRCYGEVAGARARFEEGFLERIRAALTAEQRAVLGGEGAAMGL